MKRLSSLKHDASDVSVAYTIVKVLGRTMASAGHRQGILGRMQWLAHWPHLKLVRISCCSI